MNDNIQIPISSILTKYERDYVKGLDDIEFLTKTLQKYPDHRHLNPDAREFDYSTEYKYEYSTSYIHNTMLKDYLYNGHKPFKDMNLSEIINTKFLEWLKYQLMLDLHVENSKHYLYRARRHVVKESTTDGNKYTRSDCNIFSKFNYAVTLCMIEKKLSDLELSVSDIDIDDVSAVIITVDSNGISIPKERFYYKKKPISFERSYMWDGYGIMVPFTNDTHESIVVPIVSVAHKDREDRFKLFAENMKKGILHYIHKYQKSDNIS